MDKTKNPAVSPNPSDSGRLTDSRERAWQIEAELVGLLYKQAPTGFVATILNVCIAAFVLWPAVAPSLLIAWVAFIGTITLARFALVRYYQRVVPAADQTRYWRILFTLGAASAGTAWGAAGVFLFPPESIISQVFLAFILGGMAAGAMVTLAPVTTAFLAFFLPTLLPITGRLFFQGGVVPTAMGFLLLVFAGVLLLIARHLRSSIAESLSLRLDNLQSLSLAKEHFRSLNAASPIGIFQTDAEGRSLYTNARWQEFAGLTAEESLGDGWGRAIHPEDRAAVFAEWFAIVNEGRELSREFRFLKPNGEVRWAHVRAAVSRADTGELLGYVGTIEDITARKQMEEALRESEERYRIISQSIFDYAFSFSLREGGSVSLDWLTGNFSKITGYEVQELVGEDDPLRIYIHPHDLDRVREIFRTSTSHNPISYEFRIIRKDGSIRWLWSHAYQVFGAQGQVIRIYGATQDITERKQAEGRFRELLEYAPDAMVITDKEGKITLVNSQTEKVFGYQREELLGQTIETLVPERFRSRHVEHRTGYFLQPHARPMGAGLELCGLRKDGSEFPVEVSLSLFKTEEGSLAMSAIRDLTDRKQMEEALRQSEARLRQLLDTLPAGVFVVDATAKPLYANLTAQQLLGRDTESDTTLEQLAGRYNVFLAGTDQPYPAERMPLLRALSGQVTTVNDMELRRGEQVIPLQVTGAPVFDAAGRVESAIVVFSDISELKRVDRMKNEFISTVSHELRTPLTSIHGSLRLIAGGVTGDLPAQAKTFVEIASKNCERLILLINDILDIEKIESGKLVFHHVPVELLTVIEQALEANRAYGEQYGVHFVLEDVLPEAQVNADKDRLLQVLTNLLSNAAKFSPPNGTVHVAMSRHTDGLRVAITDHGPGIPEEFRGRIFGKFAQADSSNTRQKGGTGLGLSICKAIVERLGGQIGFVTQPHQETTFYFDLPEWRPEGPQLVTAPASPDAPRILVCEDDRDIAALLVFILTQGGYRAETAYDAAQTKALLASNHYAAMILDVLLPDQNGLALLQELRTQEMTRRLPIIVVSVMAPEGRHELEGEAVCVVDWLQKPIDDQRLLAALSQAVNGYSTRRQPRILYIEDDAATQQVVSLLLKDVAQVVPVIGLQAAKQHLAREHFDLAILDLGLPDGVGWELLPHLRDQGGGPIPVVVFSAAEPCAEMARQVAASLVKTRVSTQVLYETVQWVLRHQRWGHTSLSAHSGQTQEVLL